MGGVELVPTLTSWGCLSTSISGRGEMYRKIRSVSRIDSTLNPRPRKLDIGRRNDIRPIEFAIGKRAPYDTEGLFCYSYKSNIFQTYELSCGILWQSVKIPIATIEFGQNHRETAADHRNIVTIAEARVTPRR